MVCVFIPEEKSKSIQSVKLKLTSSPKRTEELIKFGHMWKKMIDIPQSAEKIEYTYRVKLTISGFIYNSNEKFKDDKHHRWITSNDKYIQRDIIVGVKHFQDPTAGIIAHIEDILENLNEKYAFDELDNMSRNNKIQKQWDSAFHRLLHTDSMVTKDVCLLLLHCIRNGYVTEDIPLASRVASEIWEQVQHLDKRYYEMCVQVARNLLSIYKTSKQMSYCLLHFINEGQFFLSAPAICEIIPLEQQRSYEGNCCNSLSCLKSAYKFIFEQETDSRELISVIDLLLNAISTENLIKLHQIDREIKLLDKNKNLMKKFKMAIFEKVKSKLSEYVYSSPLNTAKELILMADDDLKPSLILHCEKEILKHIEQIRPIENFLSELESIYKGTFFQNKDQQLLLLEGLLKVPDKPRILLRDILLSFESEDAKGAIDILKEAFNALFDSPIVHDTKEVFLEFDAFAKKTFFFIAKQSFEEIFESHISNIRAEYLCEIHTYVEKLGDSTNEIYCRVLRRTLKTQKFSVKIKWIEKEKNDITTR